MFKRISKQSILTLAMLACLGHQALAEKPVVTVQLEHEDYRGGEPRDAIATCVAISADGKQFAAGGDDHRLRVWETSTGDPIHRFEAHHTDWIRGLEFSPKNDLIASVGADQQLRFQPLVKPLSESLNGKQVSLAPTAKAALFATAFHPTEPLVATVGFHNQLLVYNTQTGKLTKTLSCPSNDMRAVEYSSDGRWLAAAGRNGTVRLWDLMSDDATLDLPTDGRRLRALSFSPDSKQLAAAGDGPAISVWQFDKTLNNLRSGTMTGSFSSVATEMLTRPGKNYSLTFVNNEILAAGNTMGEIRFCNVLARSLKETIKAHTGTVASLANSPESKMLVSGSYDATVKVWNLGEVARVASVEEDQTTTK